MKKLLITMTATLACVGAFGQGKISFSNDSTRLVYFTTDTSKLNTGDQSVAGKGVYTTTIGSLSGGPAIVADLWAGTSASSLIKVTSGVAFTPAEGFWTGKNVTLPAGFPASTLTYLQANIHDSRDLTAEAAWLQIGHYGGVSSIFTVLPGVSTAPAMYSAAANSTWAAGTFQLQGGAAVGNLGAIEVYATVPEPGTFALLGLGASALLIFRRRK